MKISILFIILAVFGLQANAKTLLISDIDDTIKISHVLSLEKIVNASDPMLEFSGMSELYQAILKDNQDKNNEVEFAYVSNAPASVMYVAHSGFLYFNGFPYGSLLLRDSIFAENHKVETIKKLIAEEAPELVIMIGDNGEIDSQVYSEIEKYFSKSGIKFYSFIHQVYSTKAISEKGKPLKPGHNGFVTSLDLGVSLNRAGLLSAENFLSFWKKASGEIIFERPSFFDSKVFPPWLDCADYYREKNISKQYLGTHLTDLLSRKCK